MLSCNRSVGHYQGFSELHEKFNLVGQQLQSTLSELAEANVMISEKLHQTVHQHDKTTLSTKFAPNVLLVSRSIGPTFAACGVNLDDE